MASLRPMKPIPGVKFSAPSFRPQAQADRHSVGGILHVRYRVLWWGWPFLFCRALHDRKAPWWEYLALPWAWLALVIANRGGMSR